MKFKGVKNVFQFTLAQQMKTTSFKVTTILIASLFVLGSAFVNIIPAVVSLEDNEVEVGSGDTDSEGEDTSDNDIQTIYLSDQTTLKFDLTPILEATVDAEIVVTDDENSTIETLKTTSTPEVLVSVTENNGYITATAYRPADEDLTSNGEVQELLYALSSGIYTSRLMEAGIAPEEIDVLTSNVETQTVLAGEEAQTMEQMIGEIFLPMVTSLLLFFMIFMYGAFVSQSIVIEKSSRVMELLLTSIKPLAVVLGKCLAMGLIAIGQFTVFITCGVLGFFVGANVATELINENHTPIDLSAILSTFNVSTIVLIILIFIMGFALYATISALFGSTVSRAEELQQAQMPVSFIGVMGFYLSYFAPALGGATGEKTVLDTIAALVPFSSPFYLPGKLLIGDIEPMTVVLSLLILAATIVLVLLFTTKVYSTTILHTGNRLKFKDLFSIAKNS